VSKCGYCGHDPLEQCYSDVRKDERESGLVQAINAVQKIRREQKQEIAALCAENERLREQEKHWEAAAAKATAAVEADNDRLRALLTDVLYCQLGGHLNPNKTGRKMLDRIRSEVT